MTDLNTSAKNTWCPGCGNFAILGSIKAVINALIEEGTPKEKIVIVSGIGCHAKIADYLNVNSFYSLHGRVVPVATAIKLANPELKVIGFAGDGDCYGEGLEHLLFAAKRNVDITMIVHNNRVYGLTTGQYTPTSPLGYKGRSTPGGSKELPINPLEIALASGATYVARGFSNNMDLMKKLFKEGILHKGFALVDVLQVCVTFFNMYDYYNKKAYELVDHNTGRFDDAMKKLREWDYNMNVPIALGTFYKKEDTTFDENYHQPDIDKNKRLLKIQELLKKYI
ncbi:MAG: 2-oxoglutarate synthase [Elusimicrobia bacterium RIFOXYA2_FULL_40_6]|nr:MAG: 2-oxoglutarate synthase [Elusimicrobia bacterium RIFOXYA2_FULL_40_6]